MLQNSTGSINQFLQNKSYRNTFSHSIKYINSSNDKKPYFNKTLFNNAQEKISPKIEFEQDKRLLTSYNERFSGKNKSKIFSSIDNRINRSTDNFPKIILTKRGIKQLSNNAFDTSKYSDLIKSAVQLDQVVDLAWSAKRIEEEHKRVYKRL